MFKPLYGALLIGYIALALADADALAAAPEEQPQKNERCRPQLSR